MEFHFVQKDNLAITLNEFRMSDLNQSYFHSDENNLRNSVAVEVMSRTINGRELRDCKQRCVGDDFAIFAIWTEWKRMVNMVATIVEVDVSQRK